ncbi:MAG: sugar phosphate isomerase/epimerase [Calditrichaeota bacterium]|nr:sugar phosphate isomerase/epimerase [Calditrichota bacterium]
MSKIAVNLYTLRDFIKTRDGLKSTFKKLRDIGYENIQLGSVSPLGAEAYKKLLDDFGLTCVATHVRLFDTEEQALESIQMHHILNCKYSAISYMRGHTADEYIQMTKRAEKWAVLFKKNGITLAYHNHAHEFERFNGKTGLELIYENSSVLQGEIDTYWIQYGGGNPSDWIQKLSGRLPLIHLKDYGIYDGQPIFVEVGEGNLNFPRIIQRAKEAGVVWYIVEQDLHQRDPFDSVKISFNNLKAMGVDD